MTQARVGAVYMRGGTSRCLVFHESDLPAAGPERDYILLAALGSPDPYGRQLDGLGGGISSLSKACIIGPATHPGADVDYTFAQVEIGKPHWWTPRFPWSSSAPATSDSPAPRCPRPWTQTRRSARGSRRSASPRPTSWAFRAARPLPRSPW